MEYPKIDTVYDRDKTTFKVMPGSYRRPEFEAVRSWFVTEKIDGMNIRVCWDSVFHTVDFYGRTDAAQLPGTLLSVLRETFPASKFEDFADDVILFGEGYGPGIQKGGHYCDGAPSFRMFDAFIDGWWLEPDSLIDLANTMYIKMAPILNSCSTPPMSKTELIDILPTSIVSRLEKSIAGNAAPEGIVAVAVPQLFNRYGERVMWKLKFKDF